MIQQSNRAFTLVEVMLATAILVFVLSSLLLVFINCIILNESNRNLTFAVTHAEFALEEIKGRDFSNITAGSTWWDAPTIVSKGLTPLNSESLVITVTGTNPKNITANVTWKDRAARNRSLALKTLLTEP